MNISRTQLDGIIRLYQNSAQRTEKSSKKSPKARADELSLSEDVRELANAIKIASKADDVRIEKVEELKARIKAGTYSVDGKLVADKIIEEVFTDKLI